MSAFDAVRPPQAELIDDCVHCGFCLPSCPTYELWGEEMDSPRGRIVLIKHGLEEASELTPVLVEHLDRCLGCMACVTACPSGVRYDLLLEDARAQIERRHRRPARERLWRRAIFALFTHPRRLRALLPALAITRALGLPRLARRSGGLLGRFPRLRALLALTPAPRGGDAAGPSGPTAPVRGRVALLQGCVQRVFFERVNDATETVLAREGFAVEAPAEPRCCGALQLHSGDAEPARALARRTIAALEDFDYVVTNAAGCGSAMRDYAHLLRDDPQWAERARAFGEKVRDVSELLADVDPRAPRRPVALSVAYHDACHLRHAQGVRDAPRRLLASIPGLELREPADVDSCCGSAGIYNLTQPEPAAALGRRKAAALRATAADVVAAGNPGCALQIEAHGGPPVLHPVELLRMSIDGD